MNDTIETQLAVVGQIARLLWPEKDAPANIINIAPSRPATAFTMMMRRPERGQADQAALGRLIDQLPHDFANPQGGVRTEQQGTFWRAYHA